MSPVDQEVAAGVSLDKRFEDLGVPQSELFSSPRRIFGMISGMPGTGKTSLVLSCDGSFVINVDRSSPPIPNPNVLQRIWPGVNAEGQTIGLGGKPFVMKWEDMEGIIRTLKNKATSGAPRPDMVVFDTLTGLVDLGIDYLERKNQKDWKDMDGRAAYDDLYKLIIRTAGSLRGYGYGVYLICHIVSRIVQLGEQQFSKIIPELTITDSFWKRIFWQLDMSAVATCDWTTETKEIPQTVTVGGQERTRIKRVTKQIRRYRLTVHDPEYIGIARSRVDFDDVILPGPGVGWAEFEQAYTNPSSKESDT